jgi:ribosomal protein S27E
MASQTETDTQEPPINCQRCGNTITLDQPITKVTLHSYPTPAPDETKIMCPSCCNMLVEWW